MHHPLIRCGSLRPLAGEQEFEPSLTSYSSSTTYQLSTAVARSDWLFRVLTDDKGRLLIIPGHPVASSPTIILPQASRRLV
jgi:hypothetical protein